MSDILALADTLEPNVALFKGDLQKIAKIHVSFYKFYIKFASRCDALVFDKRSQDYLESCINHLENKKLTKKGIQQSRSNCLKMLDSLNDLCITLGCDKKMLAGMHKLIDQAVVDDEGKGVGTLDLLQQLKNLLNAPGDTNDNDNCDGNGNDGRISPVSTSSSTPEEESARSRGGVVPMAQYLLSDSGMDSYYHKYNKEVKNFTLTSEMNQIIAKANDLRENSYSGLDNLLAKMKINVPIWNYHVDRVDTIDSSNVMENMEIFGGNKSVTDAVLYSCPDYLTVGPFDVYVRNKVYVYHCLVNNCNNCMTTSLEFLKLHVKFQHGDSDVDWNCTDCELIKLHSSCQRSLDGALDHLAKYHSVKSTYTLAKERLLEINQKIMSEDSFDICPQLKPENLSEDNIDLFHCPNPECGFSTNSMAVAFGHYASTLGSNMTVQCRYCSLISYSTYELCEHLIKEHGNANFKCGYCPYRSVSKANCVYHQRDLHPGSTSKILGFEPLSYAVYNYSCRAHNSIKPFVCNESCNFGTMVAQKFNQHILTHPGMMVTCHYCEKYHTDDMSDLLDHFLIHGVGDYHCMYCKKAFNFIAKVEQHLHEQHSSQYPYIILCQDYETRCPNLKGKYNKVQKLELAGESLIVLPLESELAVNTANVVLRSESILIQDVDHCKMQLKTFMKNKEEPEEMPYVPPLPHIEETLDLTASEDPKERVDIKPRLRVRKLEELTTPAPFRAPDLEQPGEERLDEESPEVATFYAFGEPTMNAAGNDQPVQDVPMLTPAQIKQERLCGPVDNDVTIEKAIEQPNADTLLSSVQIKKEVHETSRNSGKSPIKPQARSPKKMKAKQVVDPVGVKMEVAESREMQVDISSSQPMTVNENREDQDAVATLISQVSSRRSSISDGESGRTPSNDPYNPGLIISESAVESSPSTVVSHIVESAVSKDATELPCGISGVVSLAHPVSTEPSDATEITHGICNVVSLAVTMPTASANQEAGTVVTSDSLMNEIVVGSSGKPISENILDTGKQDTNAPILNEASIDNIPVDFDCAVTEADNHALDTKFEMDSQGNPIIRPRYTDPVVVDTVIISSEGEDDYDDTSDRSSPLSTPSCSRPTTPSSASSLTHPRSSPVSSAGASASNRSPTTSKGPTSIKMVPKLTRIFPGPHPLNTSPQVSSSNFLFIDPKTAKTLGQVVPSTTNPKQLVAAMQSAPFDMKTVPTVQATIQSAPVDVKRYRCKLCTFSSEDRQVTYSHLQVAHPDRFSKQVREIPRVTSEETFVRAVSCPYCPDVVYEGIKSFERHHAQHHCDFSEVKCFLVYNSNIKQHPSQIFACCFCGHFCRNEEAVWQHVYATHSTRIATLKKTLHLKFTVAFKKMVCPLYNCLDEFLDPTAFKAHVNSHPQVIACKKCTYIADSVEEFQKFHLKIEPEDRLLHFYYTQSEDERANLLNVQRFSNPLYMLSAAHFKEKNPTPSTPATTNVARKTTARKSTGGAQYSK